ncbi:MAG: guanosine monophosphate reductase [Candidatus Pacebacteria bacterium]|jgi:IMP dehydrogenase|nr:guanosine monophosphate reductase [Candidatus Paceibacterota bacterium]MBT4652480.1 guanosine monophosphate reductase [Candidatus Paceibacterota bacterium]MBT6756307.1 guanosine monophosphate reductase [Candidatus Paceibacterota bacterium]MBT6921598.1 guanosine monophosphate reductase [Candidatus Paceibacterota bacterium]
MSFNFYHSLGKTEAWPKLSNVHPASLTYDDVLLVPQSMTKIGSRKETDVSVKFGSFNLKKPIVTAPMDTVSGEKMAKLMHRIGGLTFMPRVFINEALASCERLQNKKIDAVYSIGLKNALKDATKFKKLGAKSLLLDVAHGGMKNIVKTAVEIQSKLKISVIAGNIINYDQALSYKKAGIKIARVGVGGGGMCITRLVAGSGFPQLSAVFETVSSGLDVIADGGIRKPADFAKAIAAGAKVIMVGSILAGTEEAPGETIAGFKKIRGQASEDYMKDNGSELGEFRSAEGVTAMMPYKGSAEMIINDLVGGLRSAMSYSGAENIKEFQKNAQFTISSVAAQSEGVAHINTN